MRWLDIDDVNLRVRLNKLKNNRLKLGALREGSCSLEPDYFRIDQTMGISLSSDHLCIICKVYGET